MTDLAREQAEVLAQLARDVPDLAPEEFRRRLVEACGGDEVAAERLAGLIEARLTPRPAAGPEPPEV